MLCISVCKNKVFNYCFSTINWNILVTSEERNTRENNLLVTYVYLLRSWIFINIWTICKVLVYFGFFFIFLTQIETVIALIFVTHEELDS